LAAQAPQCINYQTVVRNSSGQLVKDQSISLKFSIYQHAVSGQEVYSEKHVKTTNPFGIVNLHIGKGSVLSGNFESINWGAWKIFLKTFLDLSGGDSFIEMGTAEMVSVPYALYAGSVYVNYSNDTFYNDGTTGGQNLKTTEYVWYVPGIKISVLSVFVFDEEIGGTITYTAKTAFASGGIEEGGNGNGSGDENPLDSIEVWLNVTGSGGEYYLKNNGSLSWTLGEVVIETLEGASHFLTQGFDQPEETITHSDIQKKESAMVVFPNPFQSKLNIHITPFSEPVSGTIYSNTGQALKNFILNDPVSEIQLNELKPGMYFIRLIKEKPETFMVIKQ
jgi:hypothetical protein